MGRNNQKTWFSELKYNKNPLDIRPNPDLVGLKEPEEELVNHIRKGEMCFLTGFTGAGKTSLMGRVQNRLKDHKVLYLNAENLPKDFNLQYELKKKLSFIDRLLRKTDPSKRPVLFIDEFQATDPELVLEVKGKWENGEVKSVVIAQIQKDLPNTTGSFKERLGNKMVHLRSLENDEMKKILHSRLHNKKTKKNHFDNLHGDTVDFLVKLANYNPRRLLEFTDALFDFHHRRFGEINPVKKNDYMITYYAARDILAEKKIMAATEADDMVSIIKEKLLAKKQKYKGQELKIMRFIQRNESVSTAEISSEFKISSKKAAGIISSLNKRDAVRADGMKNRRRLWALAPGMKRLLVKE